MRPHNLDKKLILSPTSSPKTIAQNYQTQIKSSSTETVEILEAVIKNTTEKPISNWYVAIGSKTFYPTEKLELSTEKETKTKLQSADNIDKLVEKNDPIEIVNCSNCEITLGKSEIQKSSWQEIWTEYDISRQQQNFEISSYNKFANPLLISSFTWKKTAENKCEKTQNTQTCQIGVDFLYFDAKEIVEANYDKTARLLNYEIKSPKLEPDGSLGGELWLTATVNYPLDYSIIREIINKNDPETAKIQLQESFPNIKRIEFATTGLPIEYKFLYIETK